MKKMFMTMLICCLSCSFCFAQTPTNGTKGQSNLPVKQAPKKTDNGMFLEGIVDSTSVADVQKGTKSEIIVTDVNGKKHNFIVKSTTTIYDSALASATLANINNGSKVKIKYSTTQEGVNEAISITCVTQ